MNSRALARLAALTQGAALVGAGVLACSGNSAPASDPSNTPASAFTLTTIPSVDAAVAPDMAFEDAAATTPAPSVDAVPSNIVDAGPGSLTTDDDAGDAGHRRRRYPTPNAGPRHGDGGIVPRL